MKDRAQPSKKKGSSDAEKPVTFRSVTLYVSKSYPGWQNIILKYLNDKHASGSLPENTEIVKDIKVHGRVVYLGYLCNDHSFLSFTHLSPSVLGISGYRRAEATHEKGHAFCCVRETGSSRQGGSGS